MENLFTNREKPYYALDYYLKDTYGEKIYKIALDGGFTCPTRDGSKGTRGCIFCSAMGSGDFSVDCNTYPDVNSQIEKGISLFQEKNTGGRYIAYFQAFTSTYGTPQKCRHLFMEALSNPLVAGLSIATRPDCLPPEILSVLKECKEAFPHKFLWVELGLQTIHETTADYIRRGYPLSVMDQAIAALHALSIPVILHIILGLPGETPSMLLQTIDYVNHSDVFGVKLQLLHVLKGTDLATDYEMHHFEALSEEDYLTLLISCLEHLRGDIVIHRLTGDGPRNLTLAPLWSLNKRQVLNTLHHKLKIQGAYQGRLFE